MGYLTEDHLTHHKCPECGYAGDDFLARLVQTWNGRGHLKWESAGEWAYKCPLCEWAWSEIDSSY
jgi:rubredoxin